MSSYKYRCSASFKASLCRSSIAAKADDPSSYLPSCINRVGSHNPLQANSEMRYFQWLQVIERLSGLLQATKLCVTNRHGKRSFAVAVMTPSVAFTVKGYDPWEVVVAVFTVERVVT